MHLPNQDVQPVPPGHVLPSAVSRELLPLVSLFVGASKATQLLGALGPAGLAAASSEEIAALAGLPPAAAEVLVAARELGLVLARGAKPLGRTRSSQDAPGLLPPGFAEQETEMLLAIALTAKLEAKAVLFLAKGGSFGLSVTVRDVLTPLLRVRAAGFILTHNHPSGDPTPSEEDVAFTNRIAVCARTLDLLLVDHLIVATGGMVSFADHGLLPTTDELDRLGSLAS